MIFSDLLNPWRLATMFRLISLFMMFTSNALAQAAAPAQQAPSAWMQALPFVALIAIVYILMIRPQNKKMKEQQTYLSSLKKGDEVLTTAGIFGTIEGLTDKFVTLEIADGVNIRVLRSQIHSSAKEVKE